MTTAAAVSRLRSANPYSQPITVSPAETEELFARITTHAPAWLEVNAKAELSKRSRLRRRPLVAVALALVTVAILASTAFAISHWVAGAAVKPHVTRSEYRRARQELVLPPGATWPSFHIDPKSVTGRGAGGGHAVLVAENAWECYWVDAIARNDPQAQERSQAQLGRLLDHNVVVAPAGAPEDWIPPNPPAGPYAIFADDGGIQWLRQTYALAAAGHPERLEETCRANAPG
jgi:hypothetical protein